LHLQKCRCLEYLETNVDTEYHQHRAEQEGDTPSPCSEFHIRNEKADNRDYAGAEEHTGRNADLGPGAIESSLLARRVLDRQQHGAAPFAADSDSLENAERQQRDRCPDADLLIGRQQAERECCRAHDDQRENENGLAADAVAEVTEDDCTHRARQKADGVGRPRQHRADVWIGGREEQLVEHDRGYDTIKEEVIPFDRTSDSTRDGYLRN